jgi:hypothetical protein
VNILLPVILIAVIVIETVAVKVLKKILFRIFQTKKIIMAESTNSRMYFIIFKFKVQGSFSKP